VIVADTSVWVAAARAPESDDARVLGKLIDADELALPLPVRLELAAGISPPDRKRFTRALTALPVIHPTEETWTRLEGWIAPAADAGHRFGVTDLLIASLAADVDALVWSLDADFQRLADLRFVRLYR
jgi:predicted nucleic acid-binding protein